MEHVTTVLEDSIGDFMQSKSFKDRRDMRAQHMISTLSGTEVFVAILTVLFE